MDLKNTTSSVAILALFDLLKERKISKAKITNATGIPLELIDQPDIRIPIVQMTALWKFAIEVTEDKALGLHLRENYGRHFMHFVITIAKNSRTLLESARLWSRYARLICEADRTDLREEDDSFHLVYITLNPGQHSISMTEHDMAQSVVYARDFTKKEIKPVEAGFTHPQPDYVDEYHRIFQCPLKFNQEENVVVLRKKNMEHRIVHQDQHLQATLRKHAETMMSDYRDDESLSSQVRHLIKKELPLGTLTIDSICRTTQLSRSTLQRRLKSEQTTFSKLQENTRKELAQAYINQGMTTVQMSLMLGFADPSSFQHAFRRWFGSSPGEYRDRMLRNQKRP